MRGNETEEKEDQLFKEQVITKFEIFAFFAAIIYLIVLFRSHLMFYGIF